MNNIKIAKELIKLASVLASSDENEELYFYNIVNSKEFPGFTKKVENDNEITFVYDADETESCYITFQNEGNECGYTVMVNNQETKSVSKSNCKDAFNDLSNHIDTYVKSFDVFLKKIEEQILQKVETYENIGTYNLTKENDLKYEVVLTPNFNADDKIIQKSIKEFKEDLNNHLIIIKKNSRFAFTITLMNKSDINFVEGNLKYYGWNRR